MQVREIRNGFQASVSVHCLTIAVRLNTKKPQKKCTMNSPRSSRKDFTVKYLEIADWQPFVPMWLGGFSFSITPNHKALT